MDTGHFHTMAPSAETARKPSRLNHPTLKEDDALTRAVKHERVLPPRSDVLRQGDIPKVAHVLLKGHTYRYRTLRDGRRQITAVLVPGDVCDLEAVMRGRADYGVGTLTACRLGEIPVDRLVDQDTVAPEMTQAVLRRLLRDEGIMRELTVSLGQRSALERLAHLFCELWMRMQGIGLARGDGFDLWITHPELADILGLSVIHTSRSLKQLRESGVAHFKEGTLTILDHAGLEKLAGFDPVYLGLTTT